MIELRNLSKKFGSVHALEEVSIKFPSSKISVILGPSGSGKTTLLRIIAGLEKPDTGSVIIDGEDVTSLPPWERGISMVFQTPALLPHMTVKENIYFPLELSNVSGGEALKRVEDVAELLRIKDLLPRYPHQLSGGQQQRVALARALVVEPKVLLLDEPLSNLDLALREELRDELRRIQRTTSVTFIYVTHDQDEALELADELLVLHSGRVVEWGDPRRVFEEPTTYEAAAVLGHNLIPLHALGEVGLKPHKAVFKGGVTYGVIPQHVIKIKECLTPNCSVIRKSLRRYYGIVTLKCGKVVLKAATPLDMLRNYVEGMKICVDVG